MFVVCEKWMETRTDCYIDPSSSSPIAALLSHLGQPGVTKGPKPSVWSWFSLRHLVSNWLKPSRHLVILLFNIHLLPLFFRLFTLGHLLIDSSVVGQYITILPRGFWALHTLFVRIAKFKLLIQFPNSWSLSPHSGVWSYTLFSLIYFSRLLCN